LEREGGKEQTSKDISQGVHTQVQPATAHQHYPHPTQYRGLGRACYSIPEVPTPYTVQRVRYSLLQHTSTTRILHSTKGWVKPAKAHKQYPHPTQYRGLGKACKKLTSSTHTLHSTEGCG
jgi:hypothetical protein